MWAPLMDAKLAGLTVDETVVKMAETKAADWVETKVAD